MIAATSSNHFVIRRDSVVASPTAPPTPSSGRSATSVMCPPAATGSPRPAGGNLARSSRGGTDRPHEAPRRADRELAPVEIAVDPVEVEAGPVERVDHLATRQHAVTDDALVALAAPLEHHAGDQRRRRRVVLVA